MLFSISLDPKLRRVGGVTGGPPRSIHSILSVGEPACATGTGCQRISNAPPGADSAPYYAALVVSS